MFKFKSHKDNDKRRKLPHNFGGWKVENEQERTQQLRAGTPPANHTARSPRRDRSQHVSCTLRGPRQACGPPAYTKVTNVYRKALREDSRETESRQLKGHGDHAWEETSKTSLRAREDSTTVKQQKERPEI